MSLCENNLTKNFRLKKVFQWLNFFFIFSHATYNNFFYRRGKKTSNLVLCDPLRPLMSATLEVLLALIWCDNQMRYLLFLWYTRSSWPSNLLSTAESMYGKMNFIATLFANISDVCLSPQILQIKDYKHRSNRAWVRNEATNPTFLYVKIWDGLKI